MRLGRLLLASLIAAVAGCTPAVTPEQGVLLIRSEDSSGALVVSADARFDFGEVLRGTSATLPLVVVNGGGAPLTLIGFEKLSGAAVSALPGVDELSPVFEVSLTEPLDVPAHGTREFSLRFTPPVDSSAGPGFAAELTVRSTGPAPGKDSARLSLAGQAVLGDCDAPSLDFGGVAVGAQESRSFTLSNSTPVFRTATIGAPESPQGSGLFTLAPDSASGPITLAPGESRTVTVMYSPSALRDDEGSLPIDYADGCGLQRVPLRGTGVQQVLTWTPATLDFGYLVPGLSNERTVTFSSLATRPVNISGLTLLEGAVPSTVFSAPTGVTSVTVPAASRDADGALVPGTASATLRFAPVVLGIRPGTLRATTDLQAQQALIIPLRGVGGGPRIGLPSSRVDFGPVAFFAGASPPSSATRRAAVVNAGTRPNPPDSKWNLHLGVPDGAGHFLKPWWEVSAKNAQTSASELCVGAVSPTTGACLEDLASTDYDPAAGLEAAPGGLALPLRVTPASAGHKEWEVRLFSNDPAAPVVTLLVTADAVVLPPCQVRVTPVGFDFGVVAPAEERSWSFRFENLGTQANESCLLQDVALEPESGRPSGAPAVFSLPGSPGPSAMIPPGGVLDLTVQVAPMGVWPVSSTRVAGGGSFTVSNPSLGPQRLPVSAQVGKGCLLVTPEAWDFGTVRQGCGTAARTITLYNLCANDVSLTGVEVSMPAGEPAGGPHCKGTTACPEFTLASAVGPLPVVLAAGASPISVQVQYRPINQDADQGALALRTTESGQALEYLVPLRGQGDAQGLNVDRHRLPTRADVLLVVEADNRIEDHRQFLVSNFALFSEYARLHQLDYRIGFTMVDTPPVFVGDIGRLLPWTSGARFVTPATPNPSSEMLALPALQHSGSGVERCLEPAAQALSAPLLSDPAGNLGLVRADSSLGVVCITSEGDQNPLPPFVYLDRLRRVKGTQRPGAISFSVFAPIVDTVPSRCNSFDNGTLASAAAALHGRSYDLCLADLTSSWRTAGKIAFGYREDVFLTARPDVSTRALTVTIDGAPVPPTTAGGASGWSYDPLENAVHFEPAVAPTPGQTVEVTYQVACLP